MIAPFRALLVAAALLASPIAAIAAPIEVVDALGRKVTVDLPAKRLVVNFNFEEFTAVAGVAGWQKVVGISRTAWEGWRPAIFKRYAAVIPNLAAMPDIGLIEDGSFSAEKLIALKPDAFLLADWMFTALGSERERIEAAGIPILVIDYNAQILERHLASTRALGKITGFEARAEELATFYESQYRDVLARVAKANVARKPRTYVEVGPDGAETAGVSYATTMWGKILTLLGSDNIAVGKLAGASGRMNPEAVIAADPEVIFIAGSSWANKPKAVKTGYDMTPEQTRASLAPYAARVGWADLSAVRSGNVNAIEHGLSRSLFDFVAMQYIGKRLYPAAFADVDPDASFRAYHEKYLPVAYGGSWMLPLKP